MSICVYALITPSSRRLAMSGVGGERLRTVRIGRVAAIVGDVRRPAKPTMRNLRRYASVIEQVAERAPAVLPARFGTCLPDLDELALILRSRQDVFRRRLRAVRNRAQMTIRVLSESDSGDGPFPSQTRVTDRPRVRLEYTATQGTQYLQRRAQAAAQAREIRGFEPIRAAVRRWVKDERVEKHAGVATVNHLIPRASAAAYRAAVEDAAERAAVRLMVTGPRAPYAFADNW